MANLNKSNKPKKASFWKSYLANKQGVVGLVLLLSIVLISIFAPFLSPYDPYELVTVKAVDIFANPSPGHILGKDDAGKDVLSSTIYGSRVSLVVGISASIIIVIFGTIIGVVAGYFGGRVDTILMRITDAVLVIPALPLMLVIISIAGRGLVNIILVIGFLSWTYMARIVRAQTMSVRERKFILRVRAVGVSDLNIIVFHILPQVLPVIFAEATLDVSFAILSESTLSFLGLGDPMLISWGSMLNRAFLRGAVTNDAWWVLFPPGIAIAWVTLGFTFMGNALQEIINPRLKTHHLFDERKIVAIPKLLGARALLRSEDNTADLGKKR